jgi:hypothetical protein
MPLRYATAEYLFNQGQIANTFNIDGYDAGACLGLVLKWLAEKKNTSNGLGASLSRLMGGRDNRTFHGTKPMALQVPVLRGAMQLHGNYEGGTMLHGSDLAMSDVITEVGLTFDESLSDQANTTGGAQIMVRGANNLPAIDMNHSLEVASAFLAKGRGMIVSVRVGSGAHVIGVYRSHGSNIHVFDPNIGVFKVSNLIGFMMSLVDYYEVRGSTLTLDREQTFRYVA